jgi:hypothetical protein
MGSVCAVGPVPAASAGTMMDALSPWGDALHQAPHAEDYAEDLRTNHDGRTAPIQQSATQGSPSCTPPASPQTMSLLDALDEALGLLESDDELERAEAAEQLSALVDGVYGEDAAALGQYVRESGALEMLLELVYNTCTDTRPPTPSPVATRPVPAPFLARLSITPPSSSRDPHTDTAPATTHTHLSTPRAQLDFRVFRRTLCCVLAGCGPGS